MTHWCWKTFTPANNTAEILLQCSIQENATVFTQPNTGSTVQVKPMNK